MGTSLEQGGRKKKGGWETSLEEEGVGDFFRTRGGEEEGGVGDFFRGRGRRRGAPPSLLRGGDQAKGR